MSFDSIAYIIGEHGYTVHLSHILFQGAAFRLQRRIASSPSFAVYEYARAQLFQFSGHTVHGLCVMYGHKVETETIDMVFFGPVFH